MVNQDLVSVVIPTYKRNDTLIRALESVINQTYKNIEIIVVDDNAEHIQIREENRRIVQRYEKIIFIENKNNLGGGLSRNEGIKVAKGKYIAFLDDDDEYLPTKIEEQYNLLKNADSSTAMVYCYANMIYVDGSKHEFIKDLEGNLVIENIINCIAATSWWMCPKEKLVEVGGFEDISSRQDASLLLKFFLKGYTVKRVPNILLNYYWHDYSNGISKIDTKTIMAEEQYRNLFLENNNSLSAAKIKEGEYYFEYRLAILNILIGNRKSAFNNLKKMLLLRLLALKNIKVLFGIIFNRTYRFLSSNKNKRKLGKNG